MKLFTDAATGQRFTVSQLAAEASVSTASIKYYLRMRLLAPGDLSAAKKAYYDASHLRRLALIRVLRELAQFPIAKLRRLVVVLERGRVRPFELVAAVVESMATPRKKRAGKAERALRERVYRLLTSRGLHVRDDSATLDSLTRALAALRTFEPGLDIDVLEPYLDCLVPLARAEVEANEARIVASTESAMVGAVVGTVLFEPIILSIRRLAHEHFARELLARS